ncbi:hypothetical protein Tco_0880279 [Tanacetum coccineum]
MVGETLYEYYCRFSDLINKHAYLLDGQMPTRVQVNTKFLNALPSEWSKLYTDPLALIANSPTLYNPSQSPNIQQGEDPIECINKAIAFLSVVASRFPPSNNQLRTSSNPRKQATIQDGRVTVQQVQGRQSQRERHMARQCTQPKRPRNVVWFKEKLMLAEAQEADCDDLSSAKAILMANLSSYDSNVLSEVPYSESYPNDINNQDVQEMQYSEQKHIDDFQDNEIHSDSNIILYSQYLQESQDAVFIQDIKHVVIFLRFDDEETLDFVQDESRSDALIDAPGELSKDTFNAFDRTLLDEITEVQTIFNQMEEAVDQCYVDKNAFEIQIKQLSIDNDQLLKQIMSQEIVHIAVNSVDILDVKKSCVNECNKCLELETGSQMESF